MEFQMSSHLGETSLDGVDGEEEGNDVENDAVGKIGYSSASVG